MATQLDKIKRQIAKGEISKPIDPHRKTAGGFEETLIKPELSEIVPTNIDEIEAQIVKLQLHITKCGWLIGKRLLSIEDNYLEATAYQNIAEYAEDKFGFKRTTAYNMIFVARNFTLVQSIELASKLYLLYPLDKNDREKYVEWMMAKKPSRKEIEERIKSEINKVGRPKKDINLSKTKLTVDFRLMKKSIPKEKQNDFLNDLKKLISEYLDV